MKLLVTGGAGFIGSHYVRTALAGGYSRFPEDCQITVVDKLTYAGSTGNLPTRDPRLTFVRGDICDRELMMKLLPGHQAVIHFAAESHVDRSIQSAEPFVMTNVVGTQTLLECCLEADVERFVHVSTDEVYGSVDHGMSSETAPLKPNSPYAASKAGSDLIVRAFHQTHGLGTIITRCSNNYGPYQFPEKIIPLFITNLLDGATVPLYGDGLNVRNWVHVDDHCSAIQLILESGRPGTTYNIGGVATLTNRRLTELLLELCGAGEERIVYVENRLGHDRRYTVDDSKIRRELGYEPRISFRKGLAETVRWYRENRAWWEPHKRSAQGRPDNWRSPARFTS